MLKIGLIDDDLEHIQLLKSYIRKYSKDENVVCSIYEYRDGINFLDEYNGELDVIFLDIEMPIMNGLDTAKKIREKDQALGIIFVTNMAQYAIKGYEVNAIDFIVKPVSYYLFMDKLKKAVTFSVRNTDKKLIIHVDDSTIRLNSAQIKYIEKDKNYLLYYTIDTVYRVRGTMAEIEEYFQKEGFSKCISGCLVNLRHVTKIGKDTVWVDEKQIPISRQKKKEFKEDFMKYIGGM